MERTRNMSLCAMFAALTALLTQISIPIGPVPITLAHIAIFSAAGVLGSRYGALSQVVFVLMGVFGLPVFSGFMGGIGKVLGPTGGFIIAYIGCAYITGFIIERFGRSVKVLLLAMCAGWLVTYTLGVLWYAYQSQTTIVNALYVCVLFFLPGDAVKTFICIAILRKLKPN